MKELLLFAKNLTRLDSRKNPLISDVSLEILLKTQYSLIGASGSGKTTLAKLLSSHLRPSHGEIKFLNEPLKKPQKGIQLVHQNPIYSFTPHLKLGSFFKKSDQFRYYLEKLNLSLELMNSYPHQLSGGEAQRLALIRALIVEPKILICDEITTSLNTSAKSLVYSLLEEVIEKTSLSILWISHELKEVFYLSDRILLMEEGRIARSLNKSEFSCLEM